MKLTAAQVDRVCGVLLGAAVGDALGAGYEFDHVILHGRAKMIGGGIGGDGGFAPGEWTDDTAQTWAIAQVAASGADLRTTPALDAIAAGFTAWRASDQCKDVGIQTGAVLRLAGPHATAARMGEAARTVHERTGRSAGNGSLMRTSPVVLAHLDDPRDMVEAAMAVSALTHADPLAGEACVLWCLAIRHAVLTGEFGDLRDGLNRLPQERRGFWADRIDEAEAHAPARFRPNGYVVTALQAAWAAITHTPVPADDPGQDRFECGHLVDALDTAIGIGDDTDTVASIAGALLGARWGASAVPAEWRQIVHGYPRRSAEDIVHLAHLTVRGGESGPYGWPTADRIDYSWQHGHDTLVAHPHDAGVLLGGASALDRLPDRVTAVVSLCLLGTEEVPADRGHVIFRLIDEPDPAANPNLDFVIDDAARTVARLRAEGHVVLLHCVAAHSRTPTVAIRYAHHLGIDPAQAYDEVCNALPDAHPNRAFRESLTRLGARATGCGA